MSFGFKAVDGCVKSALLLNDLLGGIQYSFIGFKKIIQMSKKSRYCHNNSV